MKKSIPLWVCAVVALTVSASQATPIARDSFATSAGGNDYVPFTGLLGQNPTVGVSGFDGAWGNCCTAALQPVPGGVTHPLTPGETFDGQLVSFTSDGSVGGGRARNQSRAIDYIPIDGTYYMSMLLNKNAPSQRVDLLAGLGSSQGAEASIFSVDGTYVGFVDGGINFVSGPGPNITQLLSAAETTVDETYFALLEYNYSTTGSDAVTATIYDGSSSLVVSQAFAGLDLDGIMGRFKVFTQDFGPAGAVDEWRFGTELSDVMVIPGEPCDFNNDGNCNITDLNLLLAEGPIAAGVTVTPGVNDQFDLTGDGVINLADQDQWLADAATVNGFASPYKPGDTNLDGQVDVSDFNSWNAAKFTPSLKWDDGNFNGDASVDVPDFNAWNSNKFTTSDSVSLIPEPTSVYLLTIALTSLLAARSSTRSSPLHRLAN